jgi:NAD(P)-dependent dehydrogenase (short-subunit alcohol dehydrogenase family)
MSDPLFSVENKIIVVTGACGLIGRALVKALHERGARLLLADVSAAGPEALAGETGDAVGVACDVSEASSVSELVRRTLNAFGGVDVLVNNHQYKPKGFLEARAETFPEDLWDDILRVNLKGAFLTCREFGRTMLERGRGSIINVASTYGVVSSTPDLYEGNSLGNPVAYSASKGGLIMMSRYLGAYWAGRGVRVNCVTPHGIFNHHEAGFVERFAARSPMRRMMTAEEVVGAVVFLASDASSYATGSNLLVEGGWTAW